MLNILHGRMLIIKVWRHISIWIGILFESSLIYQLLLIKLFAFDYVLWLTAILETLPALIYRHSEAFVELKIFALSVSFN